MGEGERRGRREGVGERKRSGSLEEEWGREGRGEGKGGGGGEKVLQLAKAHMVMTNFQSTPPSISQHPHTLTPSHLLPPSHNTLTPSHSVVWYIPVYNASQPGEQRHVVSVQ